MNCTKWKSSKASPPVAPDNQIYGRPTNAVLCGEHMLANSASAVSATDGSNILGSQFRHAVGLARRASALSLHVGVVVAVCPDAEMPRVTTGRIVADMHDAQVLRKRPTPKDISNSMGLVGSPFNSHAPMTICVTATSPRPACVRGALADFVPEPSNLLDRQLRQGNMRLGHVVFLSCSIIPAPPNYTSQKGDTNASGEEN